VVFDKMFIHEQLLFFKLALSVNQCI